MNLVAIGGFNGLSKSLMALRLMSSIHFIRHFHRLEEVIITALFQSGDFGGSTRKLRELFGALSIGISGSMGDLTACCAVLCRNRVISAWLKHRFGAHDINPGPFRDICWMAAEAVAVQHGWDEMETFVEVLTRFDSLPEAVLSKDRLQKLLGEKLYSLGSTLGPHSMKNILFAHVALEYRDQPSHVFEVFRSICDLYPDRAISMAEGATHLKLELQNETLIENEGDIEELWQHFLELDPHFKYSPRKYGVRKSWLDPQSKISPESFRAIQYADGVVIGAGSRKGSVGQALMIDGVADAFRALRRQNPHAPVALVMNIVTEPIENPFSDPRDYIQEVEELTGGVLNRVICDSNTHIPEWVMERYTGELKRRIVVRNKDQYPEGLIWERPVIEWDLNGHLKHSPKKLAEVFFELFSGEVKDVRYQKVGALA